MLVVLGRLSVSGVAVLSGSFFAELCAFSDMMLEELNGSADGQTKEMG